MQHKKNEIKLLLIKKIGSICRICKLSYQISLYLLTFLTVCLLWGVSDTKTAFGSEEKSSTGNIYFENDRVEAGVSLQVLGAPDGSVYRWEIVNADGSVRTFITKENSYLPAEVDMEKLITVSVEGEASSTAIYFSSLPVLYINNTKGYYSVGEEFTNAYMCMQGNKTFTDKSEFYHGNINIKLRGNSTKKRDKRPFNIKLEEKVSLLGLGENKHWALLANDIDHTLMRNKLLYDFSGAIGMDNYMKSENVVLIFNNRYYGVYQLCELVNVGSDRVDIFDWEECAEKASEAIVNSLVQKGELADQNAEQAKDKLKTAMWKDMCWITSPYAFTYDVNEDGNKETYNISDYITLPEATGGVLLEMDFWAFDGGNASTMVTAYSQPLYFKSPEYAITNRALFDYVGKYIQSFEYAIHSTDFTYRDDDTKYTAVNRQGGSSNMGYGINDYEAPEYEGKHYSELFDMDSLVQNFLVCEYSMNWDSMKNSVFMYKDIEGLFHMGPEWDFDWAWGNLNMFGTNTWYPTSWHTTEKAYVREQYYQTVQWNRCLIRDPYFLVRVYEKYKEIRGTIIEDMIKNGGTIDTYAAQLTDAAAANDVRWSKTYSWYQGVGFQASIENMKEFINTRVNWLDEQFGSIDSLIDSLGYYQPNDALQITEINTEKIKGYAEVAVRVSDPAVVALTFQVNGSHRYSAKVTSGKAVCRIPDSSLESNENILNVVQILAVNKEGNYIIDSEELGNYLRAKSNYAVFYSNGENNSDVQTFFACLIQAAGEERMFLIIAAFAVLILAGILFIVKVYKKKS